ncbi:glycosyltransferase family 2 protein [Clostridium lacusfryxellense]|uniref:glycosyltransferase family 2 protein n=1 Tax=Clostridium lacusfryxellense TaxID=205328 RepID=UPI001C0CE8B9|nr:glycosyltransferase family 2 protein [Clostridium lacusfryxellense]MBU3111067.1 glycosyltransferase [Clostridium lacusfryxellense]
MKYPLISIVVPIYKVEKYLTRCINSLIHQTYKNIEIILIDDGSPDNCPQMCEKWKLKDNRIKVIHKLNEGLGYARNSGLEIASGDYVCFFDSDDYVEMNLIEDVVNSILINGLADIIELGHKVIGTNGENVKEYIPKLDKLIYEGAEVRNCYLPELIASNPRSKYENGLNMSAWCRIYKTSTLKQVNFQFVSERDYIAEDVYSLAYLFSNINSVIVIPKSYYCYCQNEGSLTTSYKADRFEKIIAFYNELEKLCILKGYNDEVLLRIKAPLIDFTVACLKMEVIAIKENGFSSSYNKIKQICNTPQLRSALQLYKPEWHSVQRKLFDKFVYYKCILIVMLLVHSQNSKS